MLTNRIVETHESGKARYNMGNVGFARNAVQIQTMRNAQVPIIVAAAGYSVCPLPRRTPAGISYKLHIGSKRRIHSMRTAALSITAASGVNKPEKKFRNRTIAKIGTELQTVDNPRHSHRIHLHRTLCPAAWFWLVKVVAVCPKAVMI